MVEPTGSWYQTSKKFSYKNPQGELIKHLFFDFTPEINLKDNEVDVVITTPIGSANHYDIDLLSGRRFFDHKYCSEEDVWKSYEDNIHLPPFSMGFIPRLLDQSKHAQKVVVFGGKEFVQSGDIPSNQAVKVRIIGGSIEQFCNVYPCRSKEQWRSKLILFAVSTIDPLYKNIVSINQLKSIVNWGEVKSFIENGRGRTIVGDSSYPAYRLLGSVSGDKSLRFAIERGHLFSTKEISTLRRSCEKVYGKLLKLKQDAQNPDSQGFVELFKLFYKEDLKLFSTCMNYVRATNISHNAPEHWFFEYFRAYQLARQSGYVYLCDRKTWVRQIMTSAGSPLFDEYKELLGCSKDSLNIMFEKAMTLLSSLGKSGREYYKYIEYDNGINGLHQKIYGWVKKTGKVQQCAPDVSNQVIFPLDVAWQHIGHEKELSE